MSGSARAGAIETPRHRLARWWPGFLIVIAGLAAYANSFSGPLVFDDIGSITENPTIRHLWPIAPVLAPPAGGLTVSGRPFLNLTLAFNYALGGAAVRSYHLVNLAIHLLAGLTLFGIVRRTLPARTGLALAIALIWTLHPLQTESVTYVVQRAESLMGLLYLLTLYGFIRYADPIAGRSGWAVLSIGACFLGMGTKEVMVSAPVIALLYDRTFLSGSFGEAWRRHRPIFIGLAATWIPLIYLVVGGGGGRSGSIGFGVEVSWWDYGLTQFQAIERYLQLAFWPHPLAFEYGTFWVTDFGSTMPGVLLVVALVALTVWALLRRPVWGFLGFWFFAILAPTSLVPGTTQMIVEHRMYLALAPLAVAIAVGGDAWATRIFGRRGAAAEARGERIWLAVLLIFGGVCGVLTARRNAVYRTEASLWADTVAKRPKNALAHNNLGAALAKLPGRLPDAIAEYRKTLQLNPNYPEAHNNLGDAWLETPGKLAQAIAEYREALRLRPAYAEAHNGLGDAWSHVPGKQSEAIAEYQAALQLKPDYASAHNNLGSVWLEMPGRRDAATAEFATALRLQPDFAEAHNNLGKVWAMTPGKLADGVAQFEEALRLKPSFAEAHNNLGNAWTTLPGKTDEAVAQIQTALRLKPDFAEAHNNLGNAWANSPDKLNDAIAQYREALRLNPDYAEAHFNLAVALLHLPDRVGEAREQLEAFLRLRPGDPEGRRILGLLPAANS
jgi:tetratricopeptide (TPR) repeat protein